MCNLIINSLFRMDLELLPLESVEIISHLVPNEIEVGFIKKICSMFIIIKVLSITLVVHMINLTFKYSSETSNRILKFLANVVFIIKYSITLVSAPDNMPHNVLYPKN